MALAQDLAPIRTYYDETWRDYRLLWLSPANYAIHFGYWDAVTRNHADALNRLNAVLAGAIGIKPRARILDAGCGVGGSAIWLAQNYAVRVAGITPVASQVEKARRFAHEAEVDARVQFDQQDYLATSFPDGSFDVVWAVESVCHALDKAAFYREARRLLRRGGRLGIVEYMRASRPVGAEGERLLHSWLSGWAIPDLGTAEEHERWAGDASFDDVELTNLTPKVRRSLARLYRMTLLAWPAEIVLRATHMRSETQHGNWRGARDQFRALQRGLWFDAMLTVTAS